MGYGFSLFRNIADRCNLAVSSEFSSRKRLNKSQPIVSNGVTAGSWDTAVSVMPSLTEQIFDEGIQWVRLVDNTKDLGNNDRQPLYEFSPRFLEELSGALSNEREILEPDLLLRSRIKFFDDTLTRNKLNVMCAIVMKLQRQTVAIAFHDISLPQWPLNDKQFHAARYRRSQLHILRTVTNAMLSNLRTWSGLISHKARCVQIVRLEHILLELPKEFLSYFRACLNAGLGTRKAAKIREKQWVECVFTVWLCGLWLWDSSGIRRCNARSGSDFHARASQWLYWVRQVYGDSPETETLVIVRRNRKSGSSRGSSRGCGGSGSESENINDDLVKPDAEDLLIAESYLRVINAAVKKNSGSLYNHSEVTVMRFLWCMNIIRQEGFMCPNLEGKTGEEYDEFILFLEVGREHQEQNLIQTQSGDNTNF